MTSFVSGICTGGKCCRCRQPLNYGWLMKSAVAKNTERVCATCVAQPARDLAAKKN